MAINIRRLSELGLPPILAREFAEQLADPAPIVGSGWAQYSDGQYTAGSPFLLSADVDTLVPNNAATVIQSQKPSDIASFYSGGKITGKNGDAMLVTIDLEVIPTSSGTTYIDVWFDIGGSVGQLYRRTVSFPKGTGQPREVNFTTFVYTLNTWEANGAALYMRAPGTASVYNIRYVIGRVHKAI